MEDEKEGAGKFFMDRSMEFYFNNACYLSLLVTCH